MSSPVYNEEYLSSDIEKQDPAGSHVQELEKDHSVYTTTTEVSRLSWVNRLAVRVNAETKGIDPVTENEKDDTDIMNAATMWFSSNMVISAFSLGCLGISACGLNFGTSVLTIFFFTLLGVMPVAFFSVFGVELGLRQMVLSRFLVGNITARLFSFMNVIACVGWVSVNTMASASLLHMVNPSGHNCPPWAACLILIMCTIVVTFFGYRFIHLYEKWSWVPNFAVFLVIIACLAKSGNFTNGPWGGGSNTAAGVLSFGSSIFGYAAGWATYAADYTVYMPRQTNKKKVFFSVVLGLGLPLLFTMTLASAAMACTQTNKRWAELYASHSVGGLCYAILVEDSLWGFGSFCCVLLAMSTVANNTPNMYSIALGTQAMWEPLAKIPRVFWTFVGNLAALAISIGAYYKFESFLSKFMDSIGYYIGIYIAISLPEHYIYRRGFAGYTVSDWNRWDKLPVGYAGCAALFIGAFGVAFGMSQSYWKGEIGRHIGSGGADIGFELGAGFAFIAYNICRPLELKYNGR
ncbi:Purine-cytosine permease FCY2 [Kluyveromyces marxianus]